MEGHWKFKGGGGGGGGSLKPKFLKESISQLLYPEEWGGFKTKKNFQGRYGYFLEQHNLCNANKQEYRLTDHGQSKLKNKNKQKQNKHT